MSAAVQLEQDITAALEQRDHVGMIHALGALSGVDPVRFEGVCLAMEVGLAYRAAVAPVIALAIEHLEDVDAPVS